MSGTKEPGAAGAGPVGDEDIDASVLVPGLLGLVLVPLAIFAVRRRLIAHIQRQMMVESAEQKALEPRAAPGAPVGKEAGDGAAPPPGDAQAQEVDARVSPRLSTFEADASTPQRSEARHAHERAALGLFRRVSLADLGAALAYALLPLLGAGSSVAIAGAVLAAAMAFFVAVRYLLHRRTFRAFDLRRSRRRQRFYGALARVGHGLLWLATLGTGATLTNLVYLPQILRGLFGAGMRTLLSLLAMAGALVGGLVALFGPDLAGADRAAGAGLTLAALAHASLLATLARRMRKVAGIRLLILRVFDIDATSSFVFNGLMRYWQHFGNHFTVVDAALVRQRFANAEWGTAFLLVGGYAALAMAAMGFTEWLQGSGRRLGWPSTSLLVLSLVAVPAWAAWALGRWRIDARFTRRIDHLRARLQRLDRRPRRADLSFRHVRALCHDNTWFGAVGEFAARAHVVLMDLRGYTHQRRGCQKEVDFLFDTVPLGHMLFLVDTANDEAVVSEMLLARWQRLHRDSPNLALAAPVIHLYLARDNDERDMQALLDRLIEMADGAQSQAPPPVPISQTEDKPGPASLYARPPSS